MPPCGSGTTRARLALVRSICRLEATATSLKRFDLTVSLRVSAAVGRDQVDRFANSLPRRSSPESFQSSHPHSYDLCQKPPHVKTTGAGGKIVHEAPLDGGEDEDIIGFWIQGSTVVGPDAGANDVAFYKYPAGGKPTKTLEKGYFDDPQGSAISE